MVRCLFAEAHDDGFTAGLRRDVLARGYSAGAADLVCECLTYDWRRRPTAEGILAKLGEEVRDWTPDPAALRRQRSWRSNDSPPPAACCASIRESMPFSTASR